MTAPRRVTVWRGIEPLVVVVAVLLGLAPRIVEAAPRTAVIDVQGMGCSG